MDFMLLNNEDVGLPIQHNLLELGLTFVTMFFNKIIIYYFNFKFNIYMQ